MNRARRRRAIWLPFLLSALGVPVPVTGAAAQEATQPLEFNVLPSGVEGETADDRLDRRLRQRESSFRSICIQCSRGDRFHTNAPFNPIQVLGKPHPE